MSNYPTDYKYTKDHEWAKIEGNTATIGITHHAQSALGDVVFCELPATGRSVKKGETFGVVESIKAVSDLYAPLTGQVAAINEAIVDNPGQLNSDPHKAGWMVKLELSHLAETSELMDATAYEKYVSSLK